mgnify:CR=1 FL=1
MTIIPWEEVRSGDFVLLCTRVSWVKESEAVVGVPFERQVFSADWRNRFEPDLKSREPFTSCDDVFFTKEDDEKFPVMRRLCSNYLCLKPQ